MLGSVLIEGDFPCIVHYLRKTWILGVAPKQLRLQLRLHGRVGDSITLVKSLSPQMSELVEDAIAS